MQQRMRVLCATTVLAALSAGLTGCSAQSPSGAALETSAPAPSPTVTSTRPTASRSASPASTQECFDVAEAVSGVGLQNEKYFYCLGSTFYNSAFCFS